MALDADRAVDRRRLKRRLAVWRVIGIVAIVAAIVAAVGRLGAIGGDHVARLEVDGILFDDAARNHALSQIAENAKVRALIVRINSPGGTVAGGEALFSWLRIIAQTKPVVAVMAEIAASGGYMAALGADYIVARAGSLTGSIGVIMQSTDISALLDKIGVKPEAIRSRPLKGQPSPLEPMTPEVREATQAVVMDFYDLFVDMVAERRAMPREQAVVLSDGRVYTGRQAKEMGLIDALGGEAEARLWLAETHGIPPSLPVRKVEIEDDEPVWRRLISGVIGKTLLSERLRLDGLISLWHPDQW